MHSSHALRGKPEKCTRFKGENANEATIERTRICMLSNKQLKKVLLGVRPEFNTYLIYAFQTREDLCFIMPFMQVLGLSHDATVLSLSLSLSLSCREPAFDFEIIWLTRFSFHFVFSASVPYTISISYFLSPKKTLKTPT